MRIRLLSYADVERMVQHPQTLEQEDSLLLCTVMEPLLVADSVLKGRARLDWPTFRDAWQTVIGSRQLYVAPLDADCLNRALFERSDTYVVTGLWSEVEAQNLPPDRIVRRLILRSSEQIWWGDELYAEMEAWYEEELNG